VADEYHPGKYLEEIANRCKRLTVNEMVKSVEDTIRKNRLGFGHYLFDGAHAPKDAWTIPGALDYDVVKDREGVEVMFKAGPFDKEELTVHVEEGSLDVVALHEETDDKGNQTRRVKVSKHVPVPFDFDLEDVEASFKDEVLVVRIPHMKKPRRKVEIV
jgi:HSP20 family molecular chaperone IbpA